MRKWQRWAAERKSFDSFAKEQVSGRVQAYPPPPASSSIQQEPQRKTRRQPNCKCTSRTTDIRRADQWKFCFGSNNKKEIPRSCYHPDFWGRREMKPRMFSSCFPIMQVYQKSRNWSNNGKTHLLRTAKAWWAISHHQNDVGSLTLSDIKTRATSRSFHDNNLLAPAATTEFFAPVWVGVSTFRSTLVFGLRWICRGGQLTAVQDAASSTPREKCPAALGQAGRPGPDGGPLYGAIAEPHQPVGILWGPRHLLPLHELIWRGRWGWVPIRYMHASTIRWLSRT